MRLEVKEIRKSFGEKEVLHGVSFQVDSGSALGLLGRNGAGKTTTIRILMDVFHADSGEICLDGRKFVPSKQQIGYLPEERGLYPKRTVMDQMLYLAALRGMRSPDAKKSAEKWLARLEVSEYASRKLETLSKGNQQKVQLAATLVCDPEIVILDEPFSGLDPVNSQILKDVVNELIAGGKLVIFSSHQMSYVEEFCDNIAVIDHGQVVLAGELKEIKKEYGKNRLMLAAENYSLEQLAEKTEREWSNLVSVSGRKKEFLILELKEGADRRGFMEKLVESDVTVEKFGRYEPSLNDIFVSKVGEEE
ncbi:ATP-binding cassette domain-containing protein [Acetatifactor muris]|uniref:ABC-type transporter ATP-binding protein EcsA n=1 Tax=Acetatifactor muris TaxID=879566 RepID=A0A2K4ZF19_9FIRM|nr:ATP-binding cassette domain-containing protein [Acetatifactor muris]MCR2047246.1 ATP-binding cassette domain-containing protein [Acetatifactor muris]SOY29051.1 ABC-type transporter ATP-binding protein EcsA [Acetatifactor muris]